MLGVLETDKISSSVEAPFSGVLRRKVAREDEPLAVGALLGVVVEGGRATRRSTHWCNASRPNSYPPTRTLGIADRHRQSSWTGASCAISTAAKTSGATADPRFRWRPEQLVVQPRALAAERQVIALDLPGHGESGKALVRGDLDELSGSVLALLDHLDLEQVHLSGHSMGGAVALNCARLAPQRVLSA